MRKQIKRVLGRARYAAIGGAIGAGIGGLISRNAASTGGAIGGLVGATLGETSVSAKSVIDEVKTRGDDVKVRREEA